MFGVINYGGYNTENGIRFYVKEFAKTGDFFLDVINIDGNRLRILTSVSVETFGEEIVKNNLANQPLELIESFLKNVTKITYYKFFWSVGIEYNKKLVKNTIENLERCLAEDRMWG